MWFQSLGQEDTLEEGMATHSSILAWRIPWTEEPDGLQFMGSQRVGQDWSDSAHTKWDSSSCLENISWGPGANQTFVGLIGKFTFSIESILYLFFFFFLFTELIYHHCINWFLVRMVTFLHCTDASGNMLKLALDSRLKRRLCCIVLNVECGKQVSLVCIV